MMEIHGERLIEEKERIFVVSQCIIVSMVENYELVVYEEAGIAYCGLYDVCSCGT